MNTIDWLYESSPTSEPDDNELDTGFCGQLSCGLKLEEEFEFAPPNEHLIHNSPTNQFYREEMTLPLNNRLPKIEPNQCEFESNAQNNTPDQMDIYRDLILRHLIQDIATTCSKLSLPTDPNMWTVEQTGRWVLEICEQFNLPIPQSLNVTGKKMMEMSQEEFFAHVSHGGDTLYGQFQLWKTAFESNNQQKAPIRQPNNMGASVANKSWEPVATDSENAASATLHEHINSTINNSPVMPNEHLHSNFYPNFTQQPQNNYSSPPQMVNHQSAHFYSQNHTFQQNEYYNDYSNSHVMASPSESDISSNSSTIDEDPLDIRFMGFDHQNRLPYDGGVQNVPYFDGNMLINAHNSMFSQPQINGMQNFSSLQNGNAKLNNYSNNVSSAYSKSSSGSIHLWHFIRELLDQPEKYSSCVRWVNRQEGTFKIESSHNLAKFWGQRKNRSAMNYDKLSRSLRQYYKKNIISKPLKKQRLVYRFLPPYNN